MDTTVLYLIIAGLVAALCVYFLPSIIASQHRHRERRAIFVLNLLLGWTFAGWAVALVWSLTSNVEHTTDLETRRLERANVAAQNARLTASAKRGTISDALALRQRLVEGGADASVVGNLDKAITDYQIGRLDDAQLNEALDVALYPDLELVRDEPAAKRLISDEHEIRTLADQTATERDPLFRQAANVCIQNRLGSMSLLQRRLSIGYGRAAGLIDQLELAGILGPANGSKPREVLVGLTDLGGQEAQPRQILARLNWKVRLERWWTVGKSETPVWLFVLAGGLVIVVMLGLVALLMGRPLR